ncbi:MAG: hypothetical protein WAQ29_06295 [Nitrososphaeraceae archaeon]
MVTEKSSDEKPEKREPTVKISKTAESDLFWIEYGRKTLTETIEVMDERAKFMVTTCSSLIIIDFGLLLAFNTSGISFKVAPAFFFVVAAALFVLSYFPLSKDYNLQVPKDIKSAYDYWRKWKLRWNRIGFGFFLAGLLAVALTSLI